MNDSITIEPSGPVFGRIRPPGSKSITNRALVCAALAEGTSRLIGALESEDTRVMVEALRQLGIRIDADRRAAQLSVVGCGGHFAAQRALLQVANSGTTIRFLTALATLGRGSYVLDGNERMRQRPIGDLLRALNQLGATAASSNSNDCPPVLVAAHGLPGGKARVGGGISSQFLSALLMVSPYAQQDVELIVEGTLVSQPYVLMTLKVMSAFGVEVPRNSMQHFKLRSGRRYQALTYEIEPDASAASYFWAAAAITGGRVTVQGLSADSLQGDVRFCDCLQQMGCRVDWTSDSTTVEGAPLRGITANMNPISDTVQTLAAVALFAEGPTTITGVSHIRHKETDRIGDLARELRKLGAEVDELPDGLRITPAPLRPADLETYNDHRMAMSLALVGLRSRGVTIRNPSCTEKTYPDFFRDLQKIRAGANQEN